MIRMFAVKCMLVRCFAALFNKLPRSKRQGINPLFYEKAGEYQPPKPDMPAEEAEELLVIIFYSERDMITTKQV